MSSPGLSAADIILVLVFWLIVGRLGYRQRATQFPRIPQIEPDQLASHPLVSIIVPARNEAHQIATCVQSLLAQNYPRFELIVVDDCSEDGTAAILADLAATTPRLTVVNGRAPQEGWMGKTHAIYQGYQVAKGDWLLFTDADTIHAPGLLTGVMALLLRNSAACATVIGHQRAPGWGTYVVNLAVFMGIFMLTDPRRYRDPQSPTSTLNGQYILFARQAYEAIGTHAAVQRFPSDDAALGYLAKLSGYIPFLIDGSDGLQTTMYRTLSDAWRGWSRSMINNMWTISGPRHGSMVLAVLPVMMGLFWVLPWLLGSYGIVWEDRSMLVVGLCQILAGLTALRLAGNRWLAALRDVLVMPLAVLLLMAMIWSGLAQAWYRGGMVWKGRVVLAQHRLPPWNPQVSTRRIEPRGYENKRESTIEK